MRPTSHTKALARGSEIGGGPICLGFGDCAALLLAVVLLMVSALWPRRLARSSSSTADRP